MHTAVEGLEMSMCKSIRFSGPATQEPADNGRKYKPVWERVADGENEAKGNEGTKRMVRDEQTKMLQLLGMIDLSESIMRGLSRRLEMVPRGTARMKQVKSLVAKLAFDVINTAPIEQRIHMRDQIPGIEIISGIKAQMPRDPEATFGQFLNFKQLAIATTAIQEQCALCTIEDPAQQAKCPYARLMDVLPVDKIDEEAKGCGWFHKWGI